MQQASHTDMMIDCTHLSPNYNQRIIFLVLHYTALDFKTSLRVLTDPERKVSAHYLVPEKEIDNQRKIFQLVKETKCAWHAGESYWQGRSNINGSSIGIEIVNRGYQDKRDGKKYYPFAAYQIESVITLSKILCKRYAIHPTCVIGHSDCAPGRKVDPGPLFPWKTLYENGIGAWFDEDKVSTKHNFTHNVDILKLQSNLETYGYRIKSTGKLDDQTRIILQTFQMHFRPSNYSGEPDIETCTILENLIQKYFPKG